LAPIIEEFLASAFLLVDVRQQHTMHATMQPNTATPHGTRMATHKRHSVREQPLPALVQ
jgi:hypothetical protein